MTSNSPDLTDRQVQILRLWKQVAQENSSGHHFHFEREYTPEEARSRAKEFIETPSKQTFKALWDPMWSAQRSGAASTIYEKWHDIGQTDKELASLIKEILHADHYDASWQGELGARRTLWELFGFLHIEEYPIINGSAERGLSFFGYDCPSDYEGCANVFSEFRTAYESVVGHATAGTEHEVPVNFEIDQLLNVIDKVSAGDLDREANADARQLYEMVLEESGDHGVSEPEEYDGINAATEDVLSKLGRTAEINLLSAELVSEDVEEWSSALSGIEPNVTITIDTLEQCQRLLDLYEQLENNLEDLAEKHQIGSLNRASPPEMVFLALGRDLQSRVGSRVNLNQVKWGVLRDEAYDVEGAGSIEPLTDPPADAHMIAQQLEQTGQVVFYGPPGTGKTYTAQQFARWWINEQSEGATRANQLELTTFHPSFSYEDFIEGLTAKEQDGAVEYVVEPGVFKQICKRAERAYRNSDASDEAPPYVLIIDEINRGNLAQIFGELMTLLEIDKRLDAPNETRSRLAHSNESFVVPPNLYLIGTMNTADESIALLDTALRRRFRFHAFPPNFDVVAEEYEFPTGGPQSVLREGGAPRDQLVAASIVALEKLNERIRAVNQLGKGKQLGHTYLFGHNRMEDVRDTWQFDILPQLEDYYFGKFDRLQSDLFGNVEVGLIDWQSERIAEFSPQTLYEELCSIAGIEDYAPLGRPIETDGAAQSSESTLEDAWAAGEKTPETFRSRIAENTDEPVRGRLLELYELGDELGRLDPGRGDYTASLRMEIPEFDPNVGLFQIDDKGKFGFRWNRLIHRDQNDLTFEDVERLRPILETIDPYNIEWREHEETDEKSEFDDNDLYLEELADEEFDQLTTVIRKLTAHIRTEIVDGDD